MIDRSGKAEPAGPWVDVWWAPVAPDATGALAAWVGRLGDDERARLGASGREELRAQRLVAYALRRVAIADRLGVAPEQVPLRLAADGQAVLPEAAGLTVSLSHTDGLAIVAVAARGNGLGVDVEQIRPRRDVVAVARRFFHPSEAERVAAAPAARQLVDFFRLWTRKESFAKASGLDLFAVLGRRLRSSARARCLGLSLSPSHVAALAVLSPADAPANRPLSLRVRAGLERASSAQ